MRSSVAGAHHFLSASSPRPARRPACTARAGGHTPDRSAAACVAKLVFRWRWRVAACISWWESRDELAATNGPNLGPWQVNVVAHPWASPFLLTHSWLYSARAAFRISDGGRDWLPWSTHGMCGV